MAGQLSATPAPVAVGSVVDGTSGMATGTLSATGANVTVTAAGSSNTRFAISGLSLPAIIPAGQSVVVYGDLRSPLVAGADSSNLSFTSNAQVATTTDTATGTGTPAPVHTVSLTWNASTSSNISGYNIYRAVYVSSCGAFTKLNGTTLDTTTSYTDSVVTKRHELLATQPLPWIPRMQRADTPTSFLTCRSLSHNVRDLMCLGLS